MTKFYEHVTNESREIGKIMATNLPMQPLTPQQTAKYPIRRVVCKTFAVPQNYLDVTHEKLFPVNYPLASWSGS